LEMFHDKTCKWTDDIENIESRAEFMTYLANTERERERERNKLLKIRLKLAKVKILEN